MTVVYHKVIKRDDITSDGLRDFDVAGWAVLLCVDKGNITAMLNRCTHAGVSFTPDGRVRRGMVSCPLHGAKFELSSGKCVGGPYRPIVLFDWRLDDDGWIEVALPDHPPTREHVPLKSAV